MKPSCLILPCCWLAISAAMAAQKKPSENRVSWQDSEIRYLITEEENSVYSKLTTPEERERFIEQFWKRRDTNPATAVNEFREEFYARMAYANQHFTAGAQGWTTDRGRVYILYGPPNRRDMRPTGGRHQKAPWQGGDTITTFPMEIWEYNHIPGVGSDITLEFVDRTSTGMYVLEIDPNRKDVFYWRRGEQPLQAARGRLKEMPFERLDVWARLQAPPVLRFDRPVETVAAKVTFRELPFQYATGHIRVSEDSALAILTLSVRNADLLFEGVGQQHRASLQLYARVTDLNQALAYEFDDLIETDTKSEPLATVLKRQTLYQRFIPLRAGRYKMQLVLRDVEGERGSTREIPLAVPQGKSEALDASSLVVADVIQPAPEGKMRLDPFYMGRLYVVPNLRGFFHGSDSLGLYVEFYNLTQDAATGQADYELRSYLCDDAGRTPLAEETASGAQAFGSTLIVHQAVPLQSRPPGRYQACVDLKDKLSGQSVTARAGFEIR